jgi:hypothetical protein
MYAGLASERTAAARAVAARTLAADPIRYPPRYTEIGDQPVHLRHGCCLWWRTAAATPCLTCPLRVSGGDRAAPCLRRVEPAAPAG